MVSKIRFNGTEYTSPDDMPPAVRAAYDRALELAAQSGPSRALGGGVDRKVTTKVRFAYNGKVYESAEEMPPDVRKKYDEVMEKIDKDHNGVPDVLEGRRAKTPADAIAPSTEGFAAADQASLRQLAPSQPVIAPDVPGSRTLILMAGLMLIAILIGALALMSIFQH